MSTPKRASAACPFCSWATSRSYNLPYHIIMQHTNGLTYTAVSGHYLSCYSKDHKSNLEFVVCLSCHGGSMTDKSSKQRAEWITKHSKNDKCKQTHTQNFNAFKHAQQTVQVDAEPLVHTIQTINTIDKVWNNLKHKRKLGKYIAEIEQICSQYHEDDDHPYIFKTEDGVEQTINSALGYKHTIHELEIKIEKLENDHDQQLIDMRRRLIDLELNVRNLQIALRQESYKAQEAQSRCDYMERGLNRYKEHYPLLPEEDPS